MAAPGSDLLWTRVLALAETMEQADCDLMEIQDFLNGIQEGFADSADPVEDFPAYAALRLCRSMALILTMGSDSMKHTTNQA
jgi:hypothetical protein